MCKRIIYILFFLVTTSGFAHDSNAAYFNIEPKEETIVVHAEFPWSIRNALLEFAPELRNSKIQSNYEKAFFNYIKENLVLIDKNNLALELLSVEEINANGHSHQTNYSFTFKGSDFLKIKLLPAASW